MSALNKHQHPVTRETPDRRAPRPQEFVTALDERSHSAAVNDRNANRSEREDPRRRFADLQNFRTTTAHSAIASGCASHDTESVGRGLGNFASETHGNAKAMKCNCTPESSESQLRLRQKREEAFRRGLAWSILNPGEMTRHVRDQYMELRGYAESKTMKAQWGISARALLERLSFHAGPLFDFRSASDQQIHSYLSGVACGLDCDQLIADLVDERA